MKVNVTCPKCGSTNIFVRTSEKLSKLSTRTLGYCHGCHECRFKVMSEIVEVETADFNPNQKAMMGSKPLDQTDERQIEIATD
ncbi:MULTISPECIES: hypothetical protein [unclassified Pasteurella]|uniref:hypothetical protein n=1 Tax=unclassified Pasteurella TaxID=2621516 RepID=UPI001073175D|nr:hypothetical protein [Pasteurella sp. 19428wF3_WM03]TFU50656.1 hypothetical protein E4T92_08325 [Pasteurella sp. WM03]